MMVGMKGQITIRQWILGTALFAAALTCLLTVMGLPTRDALPPWMVIALWFGGGPSGSLAGLGQRGASFP